MRTSLPQLARFVDAVAIAVERGTPLAEVLRAQAVDVREAGKRALIEAGGRKEIAMMVPATFRCGYPANPGNPYHRPQPNAKGCRGRRGVAASAYR